jgi:hypothetical protein
MKTDVFTKTVLTILAISTSVIAIQLAIPSASAARTDSASGMDMVRLCERSGGGINCANISSDYNLMVEVKDLDRLPSQIGEQVSARVANAINGITNESLQTSARLTQLGLQIGELQGQIIQIGNLQSRANRVSPPK